MKRTVWWCGVMLAGLLGSGAAAGAQEAAGETALGTVVVSATRTEEPLESVTSSVSVVTERDIAQRQTTTVVEALRDVPGVDVVQPGSPGTAASVFIRGANSDQVLVRVDGIEVNSATLGGFNFGNLMTDNVGSIEVLRGAGGTLYGSEAIGGVINVMTKRGEGPTRWSLASAGGSGGTASELGTVSGSSGIVAYSASLGYLTSGGFRSVNDDFSNLTNAVRIDVTPIERGTLRGFWRFAESSLGLSTNDIGAGLGPYLDPDARERDEFYLGKAEWEHAPLDNLTYRVSGGYHRTLNIVTDIADAREQSSPAFYAPFFVTKTRVPSDIATGEAQANYSEGEIGTTTVGLDFKEQSGAFKSYTLDPNALPTRFDHRRSNWAGYAQQQLQYFENRLTAVAGIRVDDNEDFGSETSSSWSVGYREDWGGRWELETHVKGGYAEGFKAPTFNALYYPGFGNRNLAAETSSEYNGGVEQYLGARWAAVEGTYFDRHTKHLVQYTFLKDCPGAIVDAGTSPNAFITCDGGRADMRGVETAVRVGPLNGVTARGTYTYLEWDLPGGAALQRRPHNWMAASVNYERSDLAQVSDRLNTNVHVIFVGERHDLDPLTYQSVDNQPAYPRVDLAVDYEMPVPGASGFRLGWFARIQNAFDRDYEEVRGFRAPPLNVLAGARVNF